ncbi:MAG: hypothetical protein IJQ83_01600 [Bacteroidales bacterium]|nr:hypothetical protein [Bacteroidales bacterium]
MKIKKCLRIGMVAAIVVASVIILTQCFSNHENDSGTSIMVEVSATENEFDKIMNRCCEVMEKRIQLFCEDEPGLDKAKFSIKRTNDNKRIRIDFKNVELGQDQVAHVLKLLQSQGCLQFYETYTFNELSDCFYKANVKLAEKDNPNQEADFMFLLEGPLFDLLKPSFNQIAPGKYVAERTACVGKALAIDTLVINQMLIETRDLFPHDLKLAWTVEPEIVDDSEVLGLIALKLSPDNKCALNGEAISDARLEYSSYNGEPEILIMMNNEGAKSWQRITGNNIGRQIAIVFDGYVYFYPVVNSEIPNGRATISGGNLTTEGAINIVNILKAGMLPVPVTVVE